MLRNYIIVAWRNLIKHKANAFINITGLSVGLACSLMIMLWIQDERSVDGFHTNVDHLYQVYERKTNEGKVEASYLTQGLLANELKKNIPEIRYATGMEQNFPRTFEAGKKVIKQDGTYAGQDFFRMFSYKLLQGKTETALVNANDIAISRKMAELFFGSPENAMGKIIRYENADNLQVTAVFENVPANSSQQFEFLRSWTAFVADNASWANGWQSTSPATFIQLNANADAEKVNGKIKNFIRQHLPEANIQLALQPYAERYLHSNFKNGEIDGGRIEYVRLFGIVAVFILLIACINFMNLATARSTKRAKEVGVRKVIGAQRLALVAQFLSEAVLLTLIAVGVAMALIVLLLPAFNALTAKQLTIPILSLNFWMIVVGMFALTALVAGCYPAFFLASLNPIRTLKGKLTFSSSAAYFRKGLVVFQFALTIMLLIGTVVIYRQMQYVQAKNLGYDRENLVFIPFEGDLVKSYSVFKDEAQKIPGIQAITKMKESPTVIGHSTGDFGWTGKDAKAEVSLNDAVVDYDFVQTMKLELAAGRDLSKEFADSANFLLNEAAAKKIGYNNPVGMPLWFRGKQGKIVGLLKDFHFNSMHQTIEPLIIRLADNQRWGTILVRVSPGKTQQAIMGLQTLSKKINPNYTFSYSFADQEYNNLYKSEQLVSKLSNCSAVLAIFISCMGLLGLSIFVAEQRSKEISIRKVLGASVSSVFRLLSSEFLQLIIVSFLIASPIAWLVTNNWLQNFAYKANVPWWMFALSGSVIVFIAILTVSFQSIKAALTNPVKSLRSE
ncbi:ABC transporter permease [Mucilaginibacter calamicampi]|uniref:ABC transporter permease n=1 Tax=Mucilaginibacter calamicampi TaxID=1302352 RepID=A0ABW2YZW9_9SPHI